MFPDKVIQPPQHLRRDICENLVRREGIGTATHHQQQSQNGNQRQDMRQGDALGLAGRIGQSQGQAADEVCQHQCVQQVDPCRHGSSPDALPQV